MQNHGKRGSKTIFLCLDFYFWERHFWGGHPLCLGTQVGTRAVNAERSLSQGPSKPNKFLGSENSENGCNMCENVIGNSFWVRRRVIMVQSITPYLLEGARGILNSETSQVNSFQSWALREAPPKKKTCIFGHCPNCNLTPPNAQIRALCGTTILLKMRKFFKQPFWLWKWIFWQWIMSKMFLRWYSGGNQG